MKIKLIIGWNKQNVRTAEIKYNWNMKQNPFFITETCTSSPPRTEKKSKYDKQLFNLSQIMTLTMDSIHLAVVGLNKLNKTHNRGLDGNYEKKYRYAMYIKLAAFELFNKINSKSGAL